MNVYLDANATTPLDERVLEAMVPYLDSANPSSVHRRGRLARAALEQAREQVAALAGVQPPQVIFTSGGTEANNLAVKGACASLPRGTVAFSAVEHASVIGPVVSLERAGWCSRRIEVDGEGRVTGETLAAALTPDVRFCSVMGANNETGVLQDLGAVVAAASMRGTLVHSDAVQLAGKVPLRFADSGIHLLSLSAHKMHGPKGVGALVADKTVDLAPLLDGGGQERGLRAGTENVAAIVGFGKAAELALAELEVRRDHVQRLRRYCERRLSELPGTVVFGRAAERLPNTVMFGVPGIDGETIILQLDRKGVAVSSGSACHSASPDPSHVLMAMGIGRELAHSAVRVSLGKDNAPADIDALINGLRELLQRFRPAVPEHRSARSVETS